MLNPFSRTELLLGRDAMERLAASRVADIYKTRVDPPARVMRRELKKRGAWVVAFDLTDYTGSIRVNKFFPGDEGKPIVDGVKKGMHLQIQGRLNMDRFYGDMVLEPMSIMRCPSL